MPTLTMSSETHVEEASVLNANSFSTVCNSEYPMAWPVTQFFREVNSSSSQLQPLLHADITDVTCYHRRGSVSHDYLIMCIRTRTHQDIFGSRIWARCERHPGAVEGGPLRLSRVPAPAVDTIKFSYERTKLKGPNDIAIMESAFDTLQVLHVADLLHIIHSVSPNYNLGSHNCWWFAAVAIGTLQVFGRDWTIQPTSDWIKSAVRVLGRSTAQTSEEVTRRFVEKWNAGALPQITHLTVQEAWENRHVPSHLRTTSPPRQQSLVQSPPVPQSSRPARDIGLRRLTVERITPIVPYNPPDTRPGMMPRENSNDPRIGLAGSSRVVYNNSPEHLPSIPLAPEERRPNPTALSNEEAQSMLSSSSGQASAGRHTPSSLGPREFGLQLETGITESSPPPRYQALPQELPPSSAVLQHAPMDQFSRSRSSTNASTSTSYTTAHSPAYEYPRAGDNPPNIRIEAIPEHPFTYPRNGAPSVGGNSGRDDHNSYISSHSGQDSTGNAPAGPLETPASTSRSQLQYAASTHSSGPPDNVADGEMLSSLVWRILWSQNATDVKVLLAVYPAFTSGAILFAELKDVFKNTPPTDDQAQWVRPRVVDILHTWLFSEFFDSTLGSEVHRFLTKQVLADPGFSSSSAIGVMLQRLTQPQNPSEDSFAVSQTTEYGTVKQKKSRVPSRGTTADSLVKMKDRDLIEIAHALESLERDMRRSKVSMARVIRWLAWKCGPGVDSSRPFSLLSEKIFLWVVDTCLKGSIEHRAESYKKLITIAERCHAAGNLASVHDILQGLHSPLVTRLTRTMDLAGRPDHKLRDLAQSLNLRNPHRLYSINPRIYALIGHFKACKTQSGHISWHGCEQLYAGLEATVVPLPPDTCAPVHLAYHNFLSIHMESAWRDRANHLALSQSIVEGETQDYKKRERRAGGFNR